MVNGKKPGLFRSTSWLLLLLVHSEMIDGFPEHTQMILQWLARALWPNTCRHLVVWCIFCQIFASVDEVRQLWISPTINSEDEPRYNLLDAIFTCIPHCKYSSHLLITPDHCINVIFLTFLFIHLISSSVQLGVLSIKFSHIGLVDD